ncbi:hypothetical protein, partial [Stenotrophomonas maltophilia]|uniref:hypothetical protein n=1 Tax=Stenotrophomonas maltophilia TaxID=40324 RepID=UPI00195321CF
MLSIILTSATVFPDLSSEAIEKILIGGSMLGLVGFLFTRILRRDPLVDRADRDRDQRFNEMTMPERRKWRMPSLDRLPAPN